ncbi:MAG TPA: hypothetical protein VFJ97_16590 [Dermatophilaceae bacterium]|nr:hypothetical protein [Dermatophilaceae bacterium]
MFRRWRWWVVSAGVAALIATPGLVSRLPAGSPALAPAALLARVQSARTTPYAGYAEVTGGLSLPVAGDLASLTELLGGRTELRAWWRSASSWRVDAIDVVGERGVYRQGEHVWSWDYQDNRATRSHAGDPDSIRLPVAADTLPSLLGWRLLGDARAAEVTGLPSRRVAGRAADGLRLVPTQPYASVGRVDLWVDRASAVPLLVELVARGASAPSISTTFLDFEPRLPGLDETQFRAPEGARVRSASTFDLARLATRIPATAPPDRLIGLTRGRRLAEAGSVGVYGQGVTQLALSPMPRRLAASLRDQLARTPGAQRTGAGEALSVGALSLLLTTADRAGRAWLLSGTVTVSGLVTAAAELLADQAADR